VRVRERVLVPLPQKGLDRLRQRPEERLQAQALPVWQRLVLVQVLEQVVVQGLVLGLVQLAQVRVLVHQQQLEEHRLAQAVNLLKRLEQNLVLRLPAKLVLEAGLVAVEVLLLVELPQLPLLPNQRLPRVVPRPEVWERLQDRHLVTLSRLPR